jgi:DNA polymerase-3 subunit epsilon
MMLDSLFNNFESIIVFDVETTGIDPKEEEIIEIAALRATSKHGKPAIEDEFNFLVKLTPNKSLPTIITDLTGITEKMLMNEGVSKNAVCARLEDMLSRRDSLLVAYNAQFDLCFLYYFLKQFQKTAFLKNFKMLDALTIYKDRKPYPHKLGDAVNAYSLNTPNTHRASDDAKTTFELLCKMGEETDDLNRYVNLFGYNPKYGVPSPKIASIKYLPQKYDVKIKLYEA